jgi:hypothetical protein
MLATRVPIVFQQQQSAMKCFIGTKWILLISTGWFFFLLSPTKAFSVLPVSHHHSQSLSIPTQLHVGASYNDLLYQQQQEQPELQQCSYCWNHPNPSAAATMLIALNLPYSTSTKKSQPERKTKKTKTLYDVLGATRNDSKAELKRKYLDMAKIHHPDVHGTGNADIFAEIAAAYAVLSDTRKRKQYDRTLDREEISQDFYKLAGGMLQFVMVLAQIMGTVAFPVMELVLTSILESVQSGGSANSNHKSDETNTMERATVLV